MPPAPQSDTTAINDVSGSDTGEVDAFDLAVDERLGANDNAPADAAAANDNGNTGADDAGDDGQAGPAKGTATNDQAAAPAPAPTQSDDIWANAPPALREAYERDRAQWSHRLSSTTGRLSAADRELARLRKSSEAGPGSTHSNDNGGQPAASAGNPFESEAVKRFKEEYGDIADPILGLIEHQQREIAGLKAPVAEVTQQRADEARQREIDTFVSAHPDWDKYLSDERYPQWLETQPMAVQQAASRAVNVEDGHEAAWLMGQFKASLGVQAPAPKPGNDNHRSTSSMDPKRQRQLNAGRDGGISAQPAISAVPDDFDAATDARIADYERKRSRTGL
ncbi:hypothetical protein [Novosphingobium sp. FKTRR1]|uniref:hypothetical protein n=1 Tax=Novosphingobium sp. FKTRR1 TaxID=2879118 RepID=UPI001CF04C73|nr:hypothetical protein [Novosphingobium sp. FKTRR1]